MNTTNNKLDLVLSKSYDYIQRVFEKQNRVVEFDLVYGDGTIFKPLAKDQVKVIYDTMVGMLEVPS